MDLKIKFAPSQYSIFTKRAIQIMFLIHLLNIINKQSYNKKIHYILHRTSDRSISLHQVFDPSAAITVNHCSFSLNPPFSFCQKILKDSDKRIVWEPIGMSSPIRISLEWFQMIMYILIKTIFLIGLYLFFIFLTRNTVH